MCGVVGGISLVSLTLLTAHDNPRPCCRDVIVTRRRVLGRSNLIGSLPLLGALLKYRIERRYIIFIKLKRDCYNHRNLVSLQLGSDCLLTARVDSV